MSDGEYNSLFYLLFAFIGTIAFETWRYEWCMLIAVVGILFWSIDFFIDMIIKIKIRRKKHVR